MIVLFCRSRTPISWAIRQATWSDFSHVVLVEPNGFHTIEARWPRVCESTLPDVLKDNSIVRAVDLPCEDPAAAVAWAISQVGKPYDLRAVLASPFHRDWHDNAKWFCSEFIAAAFEAGGTRLFRPDVLSRITPQDLWILPGTDVPLPSL